MKPLKVALGFSVREADHSPGEAACQNKVVLEETPLVIKSYDARPHAGSGSFLNSSFRSSPILHSDSVRFKSGAEDIRQILNIQPGLLQKLNALLQCH